MEPIDDGHRRSLATTGGGRERLRELLREKQRQGTPNRVFRTTLRRWITYGVPERPAYSTLRRVDELMGWEPGSTADVLEGGEPREPRRDPSPWEGALEALERALAEVRRAQQESLRPNNTPPARPAPGESG
jgi:hypothetical protein